MLGIAAAMMPRTSASQPTPAAQLRRTLGDSLTDREFWQFFTTMSEKSGAFPSENLVSNEKTYQDVIPTLRRTLTPHGVYLGVGPEQNFTYIANLEPRLALIIDIRRENALLHLMYKALFELSPSRVEFVSRLFGRPLPPSLGAAATAADLFTAVSAAARSDSIFEGTWRAIVERLTVTHGFALSDADLAAIRHADSAFFEAGPEISYAYRLGAAPTATPWLVTYAQLQSATAAGGVNLAFLATEAGYRSVRAMQLKNLIVPVVGDFAGPTAIRGIGEYLRARRATVTAFYVSNVEQYLFNGFGGEQRFYRSVATLPIDSTSTFIRALPSGAGGGASIVTMPPTFYRREIVDSSGVQVVRMTVIDTTQLRAMLGPTFIAVATPASNNAFVSGIAPIARGLEAFANGEIKTYQQLIGLTKTSGWTP